MSNLSCLSNVVSEECVSMRFGEKNKISITPSNVTGDTENYNS